MNDLAGWLLEQIAADELEARDALASLSPEDAGILARRGYDSTLWQTQNDAWQEADGNVGTTPARVLAECDAKRRIVETWTERWREAEEADDAHHGMLASQATGLGSAVRAVAAVYADRPGYLEEWAA